MASTSKSQRKNKMWAAFRTLYMTEGGSYDDTTAAYKRRVLQTFPDPGQDCEEFLKVTKAYIYLTTLHMRQVGLMKSTCLAIKNEIVSPPQYIDKYERDLALLGALEAAEYSDEEYSDDEEYDDDDDDDEAEEEDLFTDAERAVVEAAHSFDESSFILKTIDEARNLRRNPDVGCNNPNCSNCVRRTNQQMAYLSLVRNERHLQKEAIRQSALQAAELARQREQERIELEAQEREAKLLKQKAAAEARRNERDKMCLSELVTDIVEKLTLELAALKSKDSSPDKEHLLEDPAFTNLQGTLDDAREQIEKKCSDGVNNLITVKDGRDKMQKAFKKAKDYVCKLQTAVEEKKEQERRELARLAELKRQKEEAEAAEKRRREEEKRLKKEQERLQKDQQKKLAANLFFSDNHDTTSSAAAAAAVSSMKESSNARENKKSDIFNANPYPNQPSDLPEWEKKKIERAEKDKECRRLFESLSQKEHLTFEESRLLATTKNRMNQRGLIEQSDVQYNKASSPETSSAVDKSASKCELRMTLRAEAMEKKTIYNKTVRTLMTMGFNLLDSKAAAKRFMADIDQALEWLEENAKGKKTKGEPLSNERDHVDGADKDHCSDVNSHDDRDDKETFTSAIPAATITVGQKNVKSQQRNATLAELTAQLRGSSNAASAGAGARNHSSSTVIAITQNNKNVEQALAAQKEIELQIQIQNQLQLQKKLEDQRQQKEQNDSLQSLLERYTQPTSGSSVNGSSTSELNTQQTDMLSSLQGNSFDSSSFSAYVNTDLLASLGLSQQTPALPLVPPPQKAISESANASTTPLGISNASSGPTSVSVSCVVQLDKEWHETSEMKRVCFFDVAKIDGKLKELNGRLESIQDQLRNPLLPADQKSALRRQRERLEDELAPFTTLKAAQQRSIQILAEMDEKNNKIDELTSRIRQAAAPVLDAASKSRLRDERDVLEDNLAELEISFDKARQEEKILGGALSNDSANSNKVGAAVHSASFSPLNLSCGPIEPFAPSPKAFTASPPNLSVRESRFSKYTEQNQSSPKEVNEGSYIPSSSTSSAAVRPAPSALRASPVLTTQDPPHPPITVIDQKALSNLVSLGFERKDCEKALSGGRSESTALEYLMEEYCGANGEASPVSPIIRPSSHNSTFPKPTSSNVDNSNSNSNIQKAAAAGNGYHSSRNVGNGQQATINRSTTGPSTRSVMGASSAGTGRVTGNSHSSAAPTAGVKRTAYSKPKCSFFLRGACKYGSSCGFSHEK